MRGWLFVLLWPALAVPVSSQEPARLFGELRVRPEWDWRTAGEDGDAATLLRTRIGVAAGLDDFARIVVQMQDSRAFGEEANTLADASADQLDLHQGYAELFHDDLAGVPALARLGRQEINLGNERLVGAVGWTNTGRSFDGARLIVGPGDGGWTATAFGAVIREHDLVAPTGLNPRQNEGLDTDYTFFGGYGTVGVLDLYLLHERNAESASATGIDRTTFGGRLHGRAGPIAYEAEGALQLGEGLRAGALVEEDISAWLAAGRLGWSPAIAGPLRSVRLGVDWLSGDEDDGDDRLGAFNTLFATNHKFYGFMDLFLDPAGQTGNRGLIDGIAGATVRLAEGLDLDATLHRFWFAREPAALDRDIGWELDVTLPYRLGDGVDVQAGYSAFFASDGAAGAGLGPPGEVLHWAYLQLRLAIDTPLN